MNFGEGLVEELDELLLGRHRRVDVERLNQYLQLTNVTKMGLNYS